MVIFVSKCSSLTLILTKYFTILGNLHLNITSPEYSTEVMDKIEPFLYDWVANHKGSISAEHGLGFKKKNFIYHSKSKSAVHLMKDIKRTFDPNMILNPYKVLPDFWWIPVYKLKDYIFVPEFGVIFILECLWFCLFFQGRLITLLHILLLALKLISETKRQKQMSFNIQNNTEVQSRFFKPICLGSLEMTFKTIQLKTVLQQFYNLVIGFFF